MNGTQKAGALIGFTFLSLVLVLHNPVDGYETVRTRTVYKSEECRFDPTAALKKGLPPGVTFEDINRNELACHDHVKYEDLPIIEWNSNGPLLPWFGSMAHFGFISLLITGLCGAFLWLFKDKRAR